MTISNTSERRAGPYATNGSDVEFEFEFKVFAGEDLVVTSAEDGVDTVLTFGADYVVELNEDQEEDAGGTVVLAEAPDGPTITIISDMDYTQPTVFTNSGGFYPRVLNNSLDRATILIQQLKEQLSRALVAPFGAEGQAGQYVVVLPDGSYGYASGTGSDPALRTDLAAATSDKGAALVAFKQAGEDAEARTLASRGQDTIHVFDFLTPTQIAAVLAGTLTTGLTAQLQAAVDAASALGAELFFPAGTYIVDPATALDWEGISENDTFAAVRMRSNMRLRGPGAIIKLKDEFSTDDEPKSYCLFGTDEALENISIAGLILDGNGDNNPISPDRDALTYNRFNQSHIMVSGTNGGAANAARIDNVLLEDVTFRNTAGVSPLCMAQSNVEDAALGSGWTLRGCKFLNNGLDTDDCSAVYGWANDVLVDGCEFVNPLPAGTVGKTGGNTGFEVHGADTRIVNCLFQNYSRGVWVSSNLTEEVRRTIIRGNIFRTGFYGIDFFKTSALLTDIADTLIEGNHFYFDDTAFAAVPALNFKVCVQIASEYAQSEVDVRDNKAYKSGTTFPCSFFMLTGGASGSNRHTAIRVNRNYGNGLTFGNFIRTAATVGLGLVDIRANDWHNITPSTSPSFAGVGDVVGYTTTPQTIAHLLVGGGSAIDDRGSPAMSYGIKLENPVDRLDRERHVTRGAVTADYFEDTNFACTASNRYGYHPGIAFTPVWKGDGVAITLADGSTTGRMHINGSSVTLNLQLTLGASTVIPVGAITYDLPISSLDLTNIIYTGSARLFDSGSSLFKILLAEIDPNAAYGTCQVDGATNMTSTVPITLATGDAIQLQITYQRA